MERNTEVEITANLTEVDFWNVTFNSEKKYLPTLPKSNLRCIITLSKPQIIQHPTVACLKCTALYPVYFGKK